MFNGGSNLPYSLAVAPVNSGSSNGNNGNWGDMGAWWIIIFVLFFAFGGWGNGGFGNGGGGSLTRSDLCSEFSFNDLQNGVRNVNDAVNVGFSNLNSTICHQQYDTAMLINGVTGAVNNGFSALNSTICQQQYDTAAQLNAMNMANMQNANAANVVALQNANALQAQLADCCCKNQTGQMQIGNQIERVACDTNYNAATNTTAIIQNAHNDTDRVLAKLDAMENARKDETIANLRTQLAACGDQNTVEYIVNRLTNVINPVPVPAYPAASPCGLGNWAPQVLANGYGFGYNNGCCGCNC